MAFSQISVYQVKPDRTEDFEAVMREASAMMKEAEGCLLFRLMRRTHQIWLFKETASGSSRSL